MVTQQCTVTRFTNHQNHLKKTNMHVGNTNTADLVQHSVWRAKFTVFVF